MLQDYNDGSQHYTDPVRTGAISGGRRFLFDDGVSIPAPDYTPVTVARESFFDVTAKHELHAADSGGGYTIHAQDCYMWSHTHH